MALIAPKYLDCVVAIGIDNPSDPTNKIWIGTGFLVGYHEDSMPQDQYSVFIVSNKHVFEGNKLVYLKFNPQGGQPAKDYKLDLVDATGAKLYKQHPNPNVDVAVELINAPLLQKDGIVFSFFVLGSDSYSISELKNKPAATQAEVKEPTEAEVATDKISVDLNGLKEQMIIDTGVPKDKFVLQNANILTQSEQKYIVVDASYGSTGGSGAAIVYYKENDSSDSKWKKLWEGHQMTCSGLNSEQKMVLKGIKFCLSDDGYSVLVGE